MGRLIPAGTGMEFYRNIEVENALAGMARDEDTLSFDEDFAFEDVTRDEEPLDVDLDEATADSDLEADADADSDTEAEGIIEAE